MEIMTYVAFVILATGLMSAGLAFPALIFVAGALALVGRRRASSS